MNKNKLIYLISWILFIIAFMNIFLGLILYKNIKIELYDISEDVWIIGANIINTLEKQSSRQSHSDIINNGNSWYDYKVSLENENRYQEFLSGIINRWDSVENCYNLENSLESDKCIKAYKKKILSSINKVKIYWPITERYDIVKEICKYGQVTTENIEQCIKANFVKTLDATVFDCSNIFKEDKNIKLKCYESAFEWWLMKDYKTKFMDLMLDLNEWLISVDKKWRVITSKLNKKTLEEHPEYLSTFWLIRPYFIDTDILEQDFIKSDKDLYEFLKWKVEQFNNLQDVEIYKYSTFIKDNPNLNIIINK